MKNDAWSGDKLSKLLQESVQPGFEQISKQIDLNWLIKYGQNLPANLALEANTDLLNFATTLRPTYNSQAARLSLSEQQQDIPQQLLAAKKRKVPRHRLNNEQK